MARPAGSKSEEKKVEVPETEVKSEQVHAVRTGKKPKFGGLK